MPFNRLSLVGIFLFLSIVSRAQVLDHIDVRLKILEKVAEETRALTNAKLKVSDQGEGMTDGEGRYNFTYAVRKNVDPEISIALLSDDHRMLKPLDGFVELDTSREEVLIEFLVVNMAKESEAFKKRISALETRISGLKAKNQLTQRQLNALNNQLLDTIMYFEGIRRELESEIASYENLTEEQRSEIESQREKIYELEEEVDRLTLELEAALEERYLRQNQYFSDISSNLLGYLRKAKDLRDHLPYMKDYFAVGSYDDYMRDINGYSAQYEKFDDNRLSYLEGVEHYWEDNVLVNELENLFDFLAKSIHYNQIFRVTMDIREELTRQRPKKAQKIADLAYEDMLVNLRVLEKRINRTLADLRNTL